MTVLLLFVAVVGIVILGIDLAKTLKRSELALASLITVIAGLPAFYFAILVILLVDWNMIHDLVVDATIVILSEATGLFLAKPIILKIREVRNE